MSGAIALSDESGAIRLTGEKPGQGQEEQALIDRCLAGDAEAFRPLVLRYQRAAFSVALHMLGSRADAEDVVQHGFTEAFNALFRFAGDGGQRAFSNWLIRIVVNRSKDVLKSKRRTELPLDREVQGSEAAFAHDPSNPEAQVSGQEQRLRLEAALLAVAPKYREVLILKDIEELSYEEMRSILRLPITTLKIRVVRARAMLRERLSGGQP